MRVVTKFGLGPSALPRINPRFALPLNYIRKGLKKTPKVEINQIHTAFRPKALRIITAEYVQKHFEASCRRLQTDKIHGYLGHECLPHFLTEDAMRYLLNLKELGHVAVLGIGVSAQDLLHADPSGFDPFDLIQYNADQPEDVVKLNQKFHKQHHVHHSLMKQSHESRSTSPSTVLAHHVSHFPESTVLFSSSKARHIIENVKVISQHATD